MVDFTLIEPEYPRVGALIVARIPSLVDTPEYKRLGESPLDLPGLVASALASYLGRLQAEELSAGLDTRAALALEGAYDLIEELSCSRDSEVRALLEDEVFESIRADESTWAAFERRLRPTSARVYADWRIRNPLG